VNTSTALKKNNALEHKHPGLLYNGHAPIWALQRPLALAKASGFVLIRFRVPELLPLPGAGARAGAADGMGTWYSDVPDPPTIEYYSTILYLL
jgi:hypothetical protein